MTNRDDHAPALPAQEPPAQEDRPALQKKKFRRSRAQHVFWYAHTTACGILLLLGLVLLIQQVGTASHAPTDFCQDYIAAQRLAHGEPVYLPLRNSANDNHCLSLLVYDAHPPPSVLLVYPLSFLAYMPASLIWGCCLLAAYLASGILLLRALGWLSLQGLSLFVIGSTYWHPLTGATGGQNLWQFLLLFLVIAWMLERRGRAACSGGLLGLAWLLKLWSTVLLLGALTRRQWRQALGGALVIALGTALTAAILGPGTYLTYLGPVQSDEAYWVAFNGNVSLVGVVTRLFSGDFYLLPPAIPGLQLREAVLLGEGIAGLVLLGVVAFVGWCRWKVSSEPVELLTQGILVTITPLVFPLTWFLSFITLLLPFTTTILALRLLPRPSRWWFGALILSLLPLIAPDKTLTLGVWFLQQHITGAVWWTNLSFAFPSLGVLAFAGVQGYLLWTISAQRPRAGRPEMPSEG